MDTLEAASQVDQIGIERIMEMIPHRYPFLMIDRVIDIVPNVKATGVKNVSINESFFAGHFPRKPVMPGVLIIEAMAQTAANPSGASAGEGVLEDVLRRAQARLGEAGVEAPRRDARLLLQEVREEAGHG